MSRVCDSFSATADGQLVPTSSRGTLLQVRLRSGVDAATATLYNGSDATGRVLAVLGVDASALIDEWSAPYSQSEDAGGTRFDNGIYLDVTGTTPRVVAYTGKV